MITVAPITESAEERGGDLGYSSSGFLNLSLEISEDISAGFLQTNLDNPNSEFSNLLSHQLIQTIRSDDGTTLPFCIMSSGEGYFEITSFEIPGRAENRVRNQFGTSVPLTIRFGEEGEESGKYRSVSDNCNQNTAIPITIRLNEKLSGQEIGRITGRFNLLVKSE